MPTFAPSLDDARRMLALLARPGDVFELRGLVRVNGQQHTTSGYFDDVDALAHEAVKRSGSDAGVYVTINPVDPACLARAPKNRVRRAGSGDTTSDRDVRRRRSILVDVDPVRPAGVSSTDAEHDAAIALARRIRDELAAAGWPAPILADSGNGAHLIYAVDLPVDDGGLVKRVLVRLSKIYSTPALKIDEKVFNAARISKVYGTLTKKGEDTPERPWRLARLLEWPDALGEVSAEVLRAFAPESNGMRELRGKVDRRAGEPVRFDLEMWLAEHLPDAKERPWAEGRRWIVPVCPFEPTHDRGEAYVCELASGAVSAGCLHDSCRWSWQDLRARFEPDYAERRERFANGTQAGTRLSHREPPPEVLYEDADYRAEVDAFADRDREEAADSTPAAESAPTPWRDAPSLVDEILARANDPWIDLAIGSEVIARVRAGATVVLIGGSGSGKSSLASCLLVEHAMNVGPAIALSIELPAEELAARIVGIRCDATWEDALRGRVPRPDMERALGVPRLFVLDRRRATLGNLERCVDHVRATWPDQPILVAIDYAQLLDSKEREARMRVADAFAQIDDCAREKRFVAVALSQMSRANAQKARKGEVLGAESADAGAESAAIERFATVTLTIGRAEERGDGSSAVELSIGKWRMGQGDRVKHMTYSGRSGLWRVSGPDEKPETILERREVEKNEKLDRSIEAALVGLAAKAPGPMSKTDLKSKLSGIGSGQRKTDAIKRLLKAGELVHVMRRPKGAKKNADFMVWTPDRARDAGIQIVESDTQGELPT